MCKLNATFSKLTEKYKVSRKEVVHKHPHYHQQAHTDIVWAFVSGKALPLYLQQVGIKGTTRPQSPIFFWQPYTYLITRIQV